MIPVLDQTCDWVKILVLFLIVSINFSVSFASKSNIICQLIIIKFRNIWGLNKLLWVMQQRTEKESHYFLQFFYLFFRPKFRLFLTTALSVGPAVGQWKLGLRGFSASGGNVVTACWRRIHDVPVQFVLFTVIGAWKCE